MGKVVYRKKTYEVDDKGTTVTVNKWEVGNSVSKKDAIRRGLIRVSKREMQKTFSKSELEEMGYDIEEEELQ